MAFIDGNNGENFMTVMGFPQYGPNSKDGKDLCKTCVHFWTDFPMPLDQVVPHCELVDTRYGYRNMGDVVSYPCTKCPFDRYLESNHL